MAPTEDVDLWFYREGSARVAYDEFQYVRKESPIKAVRLLARLLEVATADDPRREARPDGIGEGDEPVYLFDADPYGVFYAVERSAGQEVWRVEALLFGNIVGRYDDEWKEARRRLGATRRRNGGC